MQKKNPLQHAREAWGQDHNPFPASAIAAESSTNEPYNPEVIADDRDRFMEKLIVKAVLPPGREFGYLWSLGRVGDTGYGKTRLMLESKKALNADFGKSVAEEYGLPAQTKIAAVWASMQTTGIMGIYPLLFNAIIDAAKSACQGEPSLIESCWKAIAGQASLDEDVLKLAVEAAIKSTRRKLFPGAPELRPDILDALSSCNPDTLLQGLEAVTHASRARNGLAYFEAFYCLVRAAHIEHLFVFIDQLEDLATAAKIPRSTRQREVGRFRDIFSETVGFRGHCHAVFTFHRRAAHALADFWHAERINPPFEPEHPIGRNAAVVLQGLKTTHQVERVLATYLDSVRQKPTGSAEPFDSATFQILLERCDGRIGLLLPEAHALWNRAVDEQLPVITPQFVLDNLPAQEDAQPVAESVSDTDTLSALWNR